MNPYASAKMPRDTLGRMLLEALNYYTSGQLAAAQTQCETILARYRGHFDTLQLLGVCLLRRGDAAGAERQLRAALRLRPHLAQTHLNYGDALRELGRYADALVSYRRALTIDPGLDLAHYNAAVALEQLQRPAEALAAFERALALKPSAAALTGRGNCLLALGRGAEALAAYRDAVQLDPVFVDAGANLGAVLITQGRFAEAVPALEAVLAGDPDHLSANASLALAYHAQGQAAPALQAADRAWAAGAREPELAYLRAALCDQLQRPDDCLAALRQTLSLDPRHVGARLGLGGKLALQWDSLDEAQQLLDQLERELPGDARVAANQGIIHLTRGEYGLARQFFDAALARDPPLFIARFYRGCIDLLEGNFAAGWPALDDRWTAGGTHAGQRHYAQPLWRGEAIAGQRLFVYHEQGLGDSLQFCRYLRLLLARDIAVVLEVPVALVGLMRRSLPPAVELIACSAPTPHFDWHCPMVRLPLALRTEVASIPVDVPYLQADPACVARWHQRLGGTAARRIGLAWAGNPLHSGDRQRSIRLADLRPLLEQATRAAAAADPARPLEFLVLQDHLRAGEAELLAELPMVNYLGPSLTDFDVTAALVELCELVITVDTAAAHLAGAMGKPTWVLLPYVPDWRWLLERSDSPWYPTLRLYRQATLGSWSQPLDRVLNALQAWLAPPLRVAGAVADAAPAAAPAAALAATAASTAAPAAKPSTKLGNKAGRKVGNRSGTKSGTRSGTRSGDKSGHKSGNELAATLAAKLVDEPGAQRARKTVKPRAEGDAVAAPTEPRPA